MPHRWLHDHARHLINVNEVRDLLAESLREVSTNVSVEATLLPLTGEHLRLRSATTDSDARLDIAASGFYGGRFEQALFDVRVFSPFASSNHGSLPAVYRRQEQEKRRKYGQRVREVEHNMIIRAFDLFVYRRRWTSGDSLFETTCRPNFGEARALVQRDRDVAPDEAVVHLTQVQLCAFVAQGHTVAVWSAWTPFSWQPARLDFEHLTFSSI